MADRVRNRLTEFGFEFGAAEVTRIASPLGYAILEVRTAHACVELHITPAGKIIHVVDRTGAKGLRGAVRVR